MTPTCCDQTLEVKAKLTSRVSKFNADCGFLIRDSSFFSRLSSLLSAPSMMTAQCIQVKWHEITKIQEKTPEGLFFVFLSRQAGRRTPLLLGSALHVCFSVHCSSQVNYLPAPKVCGLSSLLFFFFINISQESETRATSGDPEWRRASPPGESRLLPGTCN